MSSNSSTENRQICRLQDYSPAWELGTGLPVALPPGNYPISGEDPLQGNVYFRLSGGYRIDARRCRPIRHPQSFCTGRSIR